MTIDKKQLMRLMAAAMIPMVGLSACTNDDKDDDAPEGNGSPKFVFNVQLQGSGGTTANVLLTADNLDSGVVSAIDNGLTNDGATQWVFYKNRLFSLTYNQGNAGTTHNYILGTDGELKDLGDEYKISRFSSYGFYNDDIITMATGDGPDAFADANGYCPQTLAITYLNVSSQSTRTNDTSTGAYNMENLLGNGEYVTLSGAEQSGSKIYCGAVPMGLSQYGVAYENHKWVRPGYDDLITKASTGQGSNRTKPGMISGTQYPDSCWVAIYSSEAMTNPVIAKTDKISYAAGRFRSQYYQTVWAVDNGDIYVFSSSYAKNSTDPRQQTTLDAGVCRIKAGTTEFDDYYCNIEEQTPGQNRSFMRCFPAGGNCFLMLMYDRPVTDSNAAATELAIFNADTKKLTYVTGLPSGVSGFGKNVYTANGKVYIPVNVENEYPAIYAIDNATAKATKGVTFEGALDVTGFGYMTPVEY